MQSDRRNEPIRIYIESGARRVFACAIDWPGWCRAGKDEAGALAAIALVSRRYAIVATEAGFSLPAAADTFDVVERIDGSPTTDFGVPDKPLSSDELALTPEDAARLAALLEASWRVFDAVVAAAPSELRKGPRGGGRDRDQVVQHVLNADAAYARKLGLGPRQPALEDVTAVSRQRNAILEALRTGLPDDDGAAKRWPLRYAVRRIAWHVLDHAWEIEDRA